MRLPARVEIAILAIALAIPCTASAQSGSSLPDTLLAQILGQGEIPWSAGRPLHWPDFKGAPRRRSQVAAETVGGVAYLLRCHGSETQLAVLASFAPSRSWVRPEIPNSSASERTLGHERTHFNLFELFAREVRRAFAEMPDICPHGVKAAGDRFNRIKREYDAMQDRYDTETRHGLEAAAQSAWNLRIKARLDSTTTWSRR
jgi:hypothetical protein